MKSRRNVRAKERQENKLTKLKKKTERRKRQKIDRGIGG